MAGGHARGRASAGTSVVVLVVGVVMVAGFVRSPAAAQGTRLTTVGRAAHLPAGADRLGAAPGSHRLHLEVALRPRDPAALRRFVTAVATPGNAAYGHYLRPGEFAERFGPRPARVAAVRSALRAAGLHPGPVSSNRLLIPVRTTVSRARKALHLRLARYRLRTGRIAVANTSAPQLPASVAGAVAGVLGLNEAVRAQARGRPSGTDTSSEAVPRESARPSASPAATAVTRPCKLARDAAAGRAYLPRQLSGAYGLDGITPDASAGKGVTIAVYELEHFASADIATYKDCFGADSAIRTINVDGGPSGSSSGAGEAALDIETAIGLAPEADIVVYQGPNGSAAGVVDTYNRIVADDLAQVVTTSWGICEPHLAGTPITATEHTIFAQAAAQGQTVLAATGDSGSRGCAKRNGTGDTELAVDDPAAQPEVTGVGGTDLTGLRPPTERVWNNTYGATGGGISSRWPRPSWQQVDVPADDGSACGSGACRLVPDVTASADPGHGYLVYRSASGGWTVMGGTSAAAPLWAALVARLDQQRGRPVGLLNPLLYRAGPNAFHDIVGGSNDPTGTSPGAYTASAGYDLASGLGSPKGAALAERLCALDPAPGCSESSEPDRPVVDRLAGANRYETAVAVSRAQFRTADSAGAVVLARGDEFADALAGTPLAEAKHAPILLTRPNALLPATRREIDRVLDAGSTIYVLGGGAALAPPAVRPLRRAGYQVVRLAGHNRSATAVRIARALGNPATVFLATGANFPDGLAAGVVAADQRAAVLFTKGNTVPPATADYLRMHPGDRYAVGGPAAAAVPHATAVAGRSRYGTAAAVAERFFPAPVDAGVATGAAFPDALAAGARLASLDAPLLLSKPGRLAEPTHDYLARHGATLHRVEAYGGPAALADTVIDGIESALTPAPGP